MFRLLRRMPFFKLLAIAQTALLARRHLQRLDPSERRRLAELVRRGPRMSSAERDELRRLLAQLGPREFAFAAADRFSPLPLRWLGYSSQPKETERQEGPSRS
jgi:hypothetical protein